MEDDQEVKHMCKFCYKSFPCGRSLGGHMRTHLINIPFDQNRKTNDRFPKKKLPPLSNHKFGSDETKKVSKLCKQCGKSFQSWKALFGHMKCHSVNGKVASSVEEDSWISSNHDQKLNTDNQSDGESATFLFRKKRSRRMKRYNAITKSCSFNIVPKLLPCVSEIDQQEEEEVALSLILLSKDSFDSGFESSDNSSEFLQAKVKKVEQIKSLESHDVKRNEFKTSKESGLRTINPDIERDESEVNSPRNLIKKREFDHFESDFKKERSIKRKSINSNDSGFDNISKFTCTVCKKAFASYQALGGHRASHKKFNGCCAPTTENIQENHNKCSSSENMNGAKFMLKKNKDHECPICFRVFPSGQALGGHKRSHLIADQARVTDKDAVIQQKPEIREFLDLNLPAPDEEEFKSWWIRPRTEHEPILSLLST